MLLVLFCCSFGDGEGEGDDDDDDGRGGEKMGKLSLGSFAASHNVSLNAVIVRG